MILNSQYYPTQHINNNDESKGKRELSYLKPLDALILHLTHLFTKIEKLVDVKTLESTPFTLD